MWNIALLQNISFLVGCKTAQDALRWIGMNFHLHAQYLFDIIDVGHISVQHLELRADLTKGFILGGISAGASVTCVLSHEAVLENLSLSLTGLLLMAASVCHPNVRPEKRKDRILSVDEVNDASWLTRKSIDYFAGMCSLRFRALKRSTQKRIRR